jgi:hypothetical protein
MSVTSFKGGEDLGTYHIFVVQTLHRTDQVQVLKAYKTRIKIGGAQLKCRYARSPDYLLISIKSYIRIYYVNGHMRDGRWMDKVVPVYSPYFAGV